MNAYELANQLAVLLMLNDLAETNTNEIQQAANMLRQQADRIAKLESYLKASQESRIEDGKYQADRIAELEYLNNEHRGVIKILMDEREALRDRIAELEKQLNTPKTYVFDGKQVFDTTPQTKPTTTLMESKAKIFWDEVNKTPQTKDKE